MEATAIATNTEVASPLTDFQKDALIVAEKELEALKAKMEDQKYLVDLDKKDVQAIADFIQNDAQWKFTEALGIVEASKELKKATKDGKLFTKSIAIEAIYYYMSKVEGNGTGTNAKAFATVDDYIRAFKGIANAVERIKADNEKVRHAEFVVAARREGIDPDSSLTTPTE